MTVNSLFSPKRTWNINILDTLSKVDIYFSSTLKILFHYTLTSNITSEKSVVNLIINFLYFYFWWSIFSFGCFERYLIFFTVLKFQYKIYRYAFRFIYSASYGGVFFMYRFMSFTNSGNFLVIISLATVSLPFSVSTT